MPILWLNNKHLQSIGKQIGDNKMARTTEKLTMRFSEQDYTAMQTSALPLGYAATAGFRELL